MGRKKFFGFSLGFISVFSIFNVFSIPSFEIYTDKTEYLEGELINLSFKITNLDNSSLDLKMSGSSILGDQGFNIKCYELNIPKESVVDTGLLSIQAAFSNSNSKQMQEFYYCDGVSSQSTSISTVSGQIVSKSEEVFDILPFSLKFLEDGVEKVVESNSLSIKVLKNSEENKENQENKQNSNKNQNQNNQQSQQNQQTQGQQKSSQSNQENSNLGEQAQKNIDENLNEQEQKGQQLNNRQEQALKNNQQNSQSLSILKNEINKLDINVSELKKNNRSNLNSSFNFNSSDVEIDDLLSKEFSSEESFLKSVYYFLAGLSFFLVFAYLLNKYLNRRQVFHQRFFSKRTPKYLELLALIEFENDYKNKVKLIAQSLREFLRVKNNLDYSLTNNEALALNLRDLNDDLFVLVLEKAERVEFARSDEKLDVDDLVEKLREKFVLYFNNSNDSLEDTNEDSK